MAFARRSGKVSLDEDGESDFVRWADGCDVRVLCESAWTQAGHETKKVGASLRQEARAFALHSGPSFPGRKGPKIVFHAEDVPALRETLAARGVEFAKARQRDVFCLCDGKDPDGNPIQLSNW